ncbi:MAG TPA: hypothetical protein VGK17_04900 [Propionicimonas sp.]|jgi:hypothetical protein
MASTSQILRALMSGDRLALIIALNPKAADVIPRGPLRSEFAIVSPAAEVALNPQPLPPAGVVVGARLMNKIAGAALAGGRGFGGQFADDLEDWCGTGWPRRWPKKGPVGGPQPDPWEVSQTYLGGMLVAAEISAHYDDPEVVAAFDKAIEMLGDAAVKQF